VGTKEQSTRHNTVANTTSENHCSIDRSTWAQYGRLLDPARQIRLLHLHPGYKEDAVSCRSDIVELSTAPAFIAISYTWGDSKNTRTIVLNGQQATVPWSCWFALYQTRLLSTELQPLWIDFICIDQDDANEKSAQVSMVGDIYRRAACVSVSLPDPSSTAGRYSWYLQHPEQLK
jgi:hypothetical protein